MTYYIEVDESIELPIVWNDDRVAQYITFCTAESEFEECAQKNGVIYASYETLDVSAEGYMIDVIDAQGVPCTHVIPEGNYGLHPTLASITEADFNKI